MKRAKIARMPPVENRSKNTLATINGTEDGILFFFLPPFALVVFIFCSHFQSNWTAYCRNKFCTDSESCLVFLNKLRNEIRNLGCDKIEISVDVIHRDIHFIKRTRLWHALSSWACSNWHCSDIFMWRRFIVIDEKTTDKLTLTFQCINLTLQWLNLATIDFAILHFEDKWYVVESSPNNWTWTQSTSLQFTKLIFWNAIMSRGLSVLSKFFSCWFVDSF